MIGEVSKILAICLIGAALCIVLRQKSAEYAFGMAVACGIYVLIFVLGAVSQPIKEIEERLSDYGVETEYFKVALKAVGLAYITDFIADACRDAGQASLASKAELAGKAAIFLLSVPILMSVLETAIGFVK